MPLSPAPAAFDQLVALFNAGRYAELESHTRCLLEKYPASGLAWKLLCAALQMQGKEALGALQKTAELLPDDAEAHNNLGNALHDLGRLDHAVASYRRALKINADAAEVYINLGTALQDLGKLDEAVTNYRHALKIEPDYAEGHYNLGVALQDLGQLDGAVVSYRRALQIKPDYAEAHCGLGIVQKGLGQLDAAVASYHKALAYKPDYAEAYSNLGNVLLVIGQEADAILNYQRALALNPDYAEAHFNLGNALQRLGQFESALSSYRRALLLKPNYYEALCNLGNTLRELGQLDAALDRYRAALSINPDFVLARGNILFVLNYRASHANAAYLEEVRAYGRLLSQQVGSRFSTWQCAVKPERLRVGLVSGDFRSHPVGYALESLLAQLDPTRIELIAYSTNATVDRLTTRIQSHWAAWKPIYGKSDADAARLIHEDGVHVLLDLSGHTEGNRLSVFAAKPAPVQASWLGYFATTGVTEMDYLLTSEVAVPKAQRGHFSERVWYLPDTWLCFTPPQLALAVNVLPALQNGYLTFGCFQRLDKISDAALRTWGKILSALPHAKLGLANKQLGSQTNVEQFAQRLQQHGIDLSRVEMVGAVDTREGYLARYNAVDIMLDTYPYPGVTTTCEALWMGVPTITLAGDTLLSRQGAGMLVPAGLSDWVATSEDEYVAKAIQHSSDLSKLAALRAGLRAQVLASPVYDAPRFARNFEAALWGMWRQYQGLEIEKCEPM